MREGVEQYCLSNPVFLGGFSRAVLRVHHNLLITLAVGTLALPRVQPCSPPQSLRTSYFTRGGVIRAYAQAAKWPKSKL